MGLSFLGGTNYGAIHLAARAPRWSITWLWKLDWHSGPKRPGGSIYESAWGLTWQRTWRSQPRVLLLGRFGMLSFSSQDAMPYGPGRQHYSRRHHRAYVHQVAQHRAKQAGDAAYREMAARLNEPQP